MASSYDLPDRPVPLQQIKQANLVGYSAMDLRRFVKQSAFQEGVCAGEGAIAGFKVIPSGTALQIAITNSSYGAIIDGDTTSEQGSYYQKGPAGGIPNLTLGTAPHATLPRVDQVVLEIKDNQHDGGGLNIGRIRIVDGVATSGATLNNRLGAAALPSTAIRLCDLLVPAAYNAAFLADTHIRDRRQWAAGAFFGGRVTAGGLSAVSGTSWAGVNPGNLGRRIECSGTPLVMTLSGSATATAGVHEYAYDVDNTLLSTTTGTTRRRKVTLAASTSYIVDMGWWETLSQGSHFIQPIERAASGSATWDNDGTNGAIEWTIQEMARANVNNGTS